MFDQRVCMFWKQPFGNLTAVLSKQGELRELYNKYDRTLNPKLCVQRDASFGVVVPASTPKTSLPEHCALHEIINITWYYKEKSPHARTRDISKGLPVASHAMPRHAAPHEAMPWAAMLCDAVSCHAKPRDAMRRNVTPCHAVHCLTTYPALAKCYQSSAQLRKIPRRLPEPSEPRQKFQKFSKAFQISPHLDKISTWASEQILTFTLQTNYIERRFHEQKTIVLQPPKRRVTALL